MTMSDETKGKIHGWLTDNLVVFVVGIVLAAMSWGNRQQLDTIELKQDKALLQAAADDDVKFVSKTWFSAEDATLRSANSQNQAAVTAVAAAVSDIKTSIAVLGEQIKENKTH